MRCVESVKFDLMCQKMCVSLTLEKFESKRKWVWKSNFSPCHQLWHWLFFLICLSLCYDNGGLMKSVNAFAPQMAYITPQNYAWLIMLDCCFDSDRREMQKLLSWVWHYVYVKVKNSLLYWSSEHQTSNLVICAILC